VNRTYLLLVLFLLGSLVCAAAVPIVDDPATSFNEADSPSNLALPVSHSARHVRPAADPVIQPESSRGADSNTCRSSRRFAAEKRLFLPRSLPELLCTFLI